MTFLEFKTWLESVQHLDADIRESLINEQPHTALVSDLPQKLDFLNGRLVDLGFENLGLPEPEPKAILLAFAGRGVIVPDTNWRLRNLGPLRSVVEPIDGQEQATLPDYWKEAVLVLGPDMTPMWIGKRVRPDQTAAFDLDFSLYDDAGSGWALRLS